MFVMSPDLGTLFDPMRNIVFSARRIGHLLSLYLSKMSRKILCFQVLVKHLPLLVDKIQVQELLLPTLCNTQMCSMS